MKREYGIGAAKKKKGQLQPMSFLLGAGVGVGVWYLLKMFAKQPVGGALPAASEYANTDAVASRLDELKTLYRSGRLTPAQALGATDVLIAEARKFVIPEAEKVAEVVSSIQSFQSDIRQFSSSQMA